MTDVRLVRALDRLDGLAGRLPPDAFPSPYGANNRYGRTRNTGWTPGFWTGLLWLAYQHTGTSVWRTRAGALLPSFAARLATGGNGVATHDLGFLYTLSCVAAWKLTGDGHARDTALRAADALAARFWPGGRIVQAWGRLDDAGERGRVIVDSVMNMPLLFWAADESERPDLRAMAVSHLDQCLRLLVRADGSTVHTCFVDTETGTGYRCKTEQGRSDGSCWSRGQAWAMYGFSLAYKHTGERRFLDAAMLTTRYFLDHLPYDGICFWDLTFEPADQQERDTSAAAIAVSAMCDLADSLPSTDSARAAIAEAAERVRTTLSSSYAIADPEEDGILRNGVAHRPLGEGVNECCLWGDYFYVEAMMRREPSWAPFF